MTVKQMLEEHTEAIKKLEVQQNELHETLTETTHELREQITEIATSVKIIANKLSELPSIKELIETSIQVRNTCKELEQLKELQTTYTRFVGGWKLLLWLFGGGGLLILGIFSFLHWLNEHLPKGGFK